MRINHKLAYEMIIWKGNGNTTTLLFSLKGLEILHRDRRKVKTIVMEHFEGIIFLKFGPANKQHTNQSEFITELKFVTLISHCSYYYHL